MKKPLLRYLLLQLSICAILSHSSCKKEDVQLARMGSANHATIKMSPKTKALVEESKAWYEKNSITAGLRDEKVNIGNPDWNSAAVFKVAEDLPEAIEMPLKDYNVNYAFTKNMAPGGFRYLLLRKNESGKEFIADVIELHPDTGYVSKRTAAHRGSRNINDFISNADFSGYFLVYTLKNILRYGELRKDGRTVSVLSK